MKNNDIQAFRKALIGWYLANKRDLPWRHTNDPYRIWVSEVMLQQTQVATVVPYYHRFLQNFGELETLARADSQDVLKNWEGLGYYARARNLHRAAGLVLKEHGGVVPNRWAEFRKLPGVGDYIAAAVLSMAFEQPFPVVDGNVKRVLARLLMVKDPVNKTTTAQKFRVIADELLDRKKPGTFNQAMMELGAIVCRPRQPLCGSCPVQNKCRANQSGTVLDYPVKLKKQPPPLYRIAVGVIFKNGRVLITRRKPSGLLGGLWEFPGGKIQKGESPDAACIREIKEEVNLTIEVDSHLSRVKHAYTHFKIVMDVFCCSYVSGRVALSGPVDHRWIKLSTIKKYPLPKANHKFLPELKEYTKGWKASGL
jgi:A/G-specific adenine glycosylase